MLVLGQLTPLPQVPLFYPPRPPRPVLEVQAQGLLELEDFCSLGPGTLLPLRGVGIHVCRQRL